MNTDAISTGATSMASLLANQLSSSRPTAAQLAADRQSLTQTATPESSTTSGKGKPNTAAEIKKAASQFEAIILRQMLAPAIEPIMSGGLGSSKGSDGGGIYGYMLTDALATNLSKAGGLGLGAMLEKQLSPKYPSATPPSNSSNQIKS